MSRFVAPAMYFDGIRVEAIEAVLAGQVPVEPDLRSGAIRFMRSRVAADEPDIIDWAIERINCELGFVSEACEVAPRIVLRSVARGPGGAPLSAMAIHGLHVTTFSLAAIVKDASAIATNHRYSPGLIWTALHDVIDDSVENGGSRDAIEMLRRGEILSADARIKRLLIHLLSPDYQPPDRATLSREIARSELSPPDWETTPLMMCEEMGRGVEWELDFPVPRFE